MKTSIERVDYKNKTSNGGFKGLPTLTDINEISDVNEITGIYLRFTNDNARDEYMKMFPKYAGGWKVATRTAAGENLSTIAFRFNTHWLTDVTGQKNEAAIKRRNKVIEILKAHSS